MKAGPLYAGVDLLLDDSPDYLNNYLLILPLSLLKIVSSLSLNFLADFPGSSSTLP